jgi:hypothetical protein
MTSFYPPSPQVNASLPQYATSALLPVSANNGDLVIVLDTNSLYLYDSAWIEICSGDTYPVSLQEAYDSPGTPLILQTAAKGGITFRQGAAQTGNLFTLENSSSVTIASISVAGVLTLATTTGVLHSNGSGVISSSLIVNGDVNASAAIDGTKINPNFGSQDIDTTGGVYPSLVDATLSVKAPDIYGSLDAYSAGGTLSIGTANANTINIGTGPGATAITVGTTADTLLLRNSTVTSTTGNIVTTGDTGTVTSTMILNDTIVDADINTAAAIGLSKLATGALPSGITVSSANIVNDTIVNADINTAAAIGLSKLATGALPSGITISSANIVDDTIVNADINTAAAIGLSKLATGALPSGITVSSANIVDDTIVNADINTAAAIAITKVAQGTANQLIGANSGATANEYKTLAVGTTGTNFAIAHAANSVTFNLPDASAANRGAITTGTQTIAGAKTLSGITTVSNTTANTAYNNGALVVSGGLGVDGAIRTRGTQIQVGNTRTADGAAQLDLIGVASGTTFNGQLIRASGTNGNLSLLNTGTGTTIINNNAGTATGNGTLVQGYRAGVQTAGYVGEKIESSLATSFAITDNTVTNVVTRNLEAGTWMVTGMVHFNLDSGSWTELGGAVSGASASLEINSRPYILNPPGTFYGMVCGARLFQFSTSTTIYLVAFAKYTGVVKVYGDNTLGFGSNLLCVRIA